MFGRGRLQNGVLIQPNRVFDPKDEVQLAVFRNKIWCVQTSNQAKSERIVLTTYLLGQLLRKSIIMHPPIPGYSKRCSLF